MSTTRIRRSALVLFTFLSAILLPTVVAAPRAAADPVIAYPNIQVKVPTNRISIAQPTASTRTLDFAHITWNAGSGPLEIRPQYNSATGTSTATQALYTLTGPSTWSFVKTVPIVRPMVWDPPGDYRFPLTGFGLYTVGSGGGVGTLVASSPKVDFCMTPDSLVGGVPNTTASASPPVSNCTNPNGVLGLSVGWGDEYDYTDAGNNIDISNLPNGTYWLRGQADPGNYFAQEGPNKSVTDTEITISGTNVTVLQQVQPAVTLPAVTITSPADSSSVTPPTTFTATVSDASPVTSVQFLLDGLPVGGAMSAPPYTLPVPSLSPGAHTLSAQAVDANQMTGTAPAVSFTVPVQVGNLQIDQQVTATGRSSVSTAAFSTVVPGELLVAMVGSDGPSSAQTATVSGAGLTWSLASRANAQLGDAEVWTAMANSTLSNVTVSAAATKSGYDLTLTVLSIEGATGLGAKGGSSGNKTAPSLTLTAQGSGSLGIAVGNDYDKALARTLGPAQALASQWVDTATGDTYWAQYTTGGGPSAGQPLILNDTAPATDRWNLAGIEVIGGTGTPPPPPPSVSITAPSANQTVAGHVNVTATAAGAGGATIQSVQLLLDGEPLGPPLTSSPYVYNWDTTGLHNGTHTLSAIAVDSNNSSATAIGVPVNVSNADVSTVVTITAPTAGSTVSGTVPVTATVNSLISPQTVQFMLDGLPVGPAIPAPPYAISWDTTGALNGSHTLTAVATDLGSNQVSSAPTTVTVANGSVCFITDVNVVANGRGPVTTAPFQTAFAGELLLAFVGSDGPKGAGSQTVSVSGAGLTWSLVKRANSAPGDSEIWAASAAAPLTNATVTATQSKTGYRMFLNVIGISGTAGVGASAGGGALTGAPQVSLQTTQPQSLVFAVGNDWSRATTHIPGTNQVIETQLLDTASGDSYWTQNTSIQSGAAGSTVVINDNSPTNDNWNLAAVEVLAAASANYQP
jgi:Bacterial Ig domain